MRSRYLLRGADITFDLLARQMLRFIASGYCGVNDSQRENASAYKVDYLRT